MHSVLKSRLGCVAAAAKPAFATRGLERFVNRHAALGHTLAFQQQSKPDVGMWQPPQRSWQPLESGITEPKTTDLETVLSEPQESVVSPFAEANLDPANIVMALQGYWQDDMGGTIHVNGDQAYKELHGLTGLWSLERSGGDLFLNGAQLIVSPEGPVWKYDTGAERKWSRLSASETQWSESLERFQYMG